MSSKAEINEGRIRYINEAKGTFIEATPTTPGKLYLATIEIKKIYQSKAVTEQGFKLYYKYLPSGWVCIRLTKDAMKPVDTPQDTSKDKFVDSVPAHQIKDICLAIAEQCEKEGSVQ